jgi:hypothetical protein
MQALMQAMGCPVWPYSLHRAFLISHPSREYLLNKNSLNKCKQIKNEAKETHEIES